MPERKVNVELSAEIAQLLAEDCCLAIHQITSLLNTDTGEYTAEFRNRLLKMLGVKTVLREAALNGIRNTGH